MNLKEDKEQLINMLTSEDKEIRKLAIDYIRNNYDINIIVPFFVEFLWYYDFVNGGTRLKIPKKNDKNYFEMNVFLECITYRIPRKKTIREMLDLIIEYNELKRR